MAEKQLKIGYIWQYEAADISPVSATALHMQAVVNGFKRRGHQIRIVTLRNGRPHWSDDLQNWQLILNSSRQSRLFHLMESSIRGLQSRLRLPFFRLFDSYWFSHACSDVLAGFDVLYERFWLMGYGGLLASKRMDVPLVYEVNGDLVEEYAHLGIRLARSQWAVIHWITRQMFQRAARVVTVSEALRQRTVDRWRLDPSQVNAVTNGADVGLFAQTPDVDMVRSRYGLDGEPVVIFVGSFKPWHGLDLLLDAFCCVAASNQEAKLVFVGDGPARPGLESQARKLKLEARVVFTGAVPHGDVASLLNAAQVAVLNPRASEASLSQSPLKLFEYMAAGKAIVAPAIPNVKQILAHRKNALLVPPDQAEALASALEELLNDEQLRTRLGQAARQQSLENHSWDHTVSRLEAIIDDELKVKNAGA